MKNKKNKIAVSLFNKKISQKKSNSLVTNFFDNKFIVIFRFSNLLDAGNLKVFLSDLGVNASVLHFSATEFSTLKLFSGSFSKGFFIFVKFGSVSDIVKFLLGMLEAIALFKEGDFEQQLREENYFKYISFNFFSGICFGVVAFSSLFTFSEAVLLLTSRSSDFFFKIYMDLHGYYCEQFNSLKFTENTLQTLF